MDGSAEIPLIKRWLKVLGHIVLGVGALLAAAMFARLLLTPMLEFVLGEDGPYLAIARPVLTLAAFGLGYFVLVRFFEKRTAFELAFDGRNMILGALTGIGIISITMVLLFGLGNYEMVSYVGFSTFIYAAGPILVASIFEEFVFRGVLFRVLEENIGTLKSLIFVSLLFGALHIFNQGSAPVIFVSVTLIGALWCGVYILSRNIWVVGLHHAAWNLAIFSSGIPLSGVDDFPGKAPMESTFNGPLLMTGGDFGPEGSAISVVVVAIALYLVLRWARQWDRFIIR